MADVGARVTLREKRANLAKDLRLRAAIGGVTLQLGAEECIFLATALERADQSSDLDRREAAVRAAEVAVDAAAVRAIAQLDRATALNADTQRQARILGGAVVLACAVAVVLQALGW